MGSKSPETASQTTNSNTTANPWAAAIPLLQGVISNYASLDPRMTGQQTAAGQNLWGAASNIPNMAPQSTEAVNDIFKNSGMIPDAYKTMQGNLLPIAGMDANPYKSPGFSDAIDTLKSDITKGVKNVYAGAGRAPSGAGSFAGSLGRGWAQGIAPVIQDQYNKNIANIMGANNSLMSGGLNAASGMSNQMLTALQGAGMIPGISMAPSTAQWGAANAIQNQPFANLNPLLAASMGLGGMGGTTVGTGTQVGTRTPANDPMSNALGVASGVAGLFGAFSDRRLKTDIKDIGRTHDNQKIYSYRFKGSNVPQIGMMADEVEGKTPEAVETDEPTGYKRVRYDKATRKAAQMGMLKAA